VRNFGRVAFLGALLGPSLAGATEAAPNAPSPETWTTTANDRPATANGVSIGTPPERRSGAVVGLSLGYGLYGASGYPNNASLFGNLAYYSASNLMTGTAISATLMDAVTDYLSFGVFLGGGTAKSQDWRSTSFGAGFRIELFPLYYWMPALKDLGVTAKLGLGRATVATRLPGNYPTSNGSQSFVGAGVFYEWKLTKLFGGHLAGGPSFDYDVITAPSIERHGASLSGRFVFYGGM
jgi:hypothetical protein